jgi:hypothetical protein
MLNLKGGTKFRERVLLTCFARRGPPTDGTKFRKKPQCWRALKSALAPPGVVVSVSPEAEAAAKEPQPRLGGLGGEASPEDTDATR